MIHLEITPSHADFVSNGRTVGRYQYRDQYRPYLHPLKTPRGHTVTLCSPHDHIHHKGVMYGLRTDRLNFWEEKPFHDKEVAGVQKHVEFSDIVTPAAEAGFNEALEWIDPSTGEVVIKETRRISCRRPQTGSEFVWNWAATLESMCDQELIQSEFLAPAADGGKIAYYGLGARLRREFGAGGNQLLLDGEAFGSKVLLESCGLKPRSARYVGSIDSTHPVERAYVQLSQEHGHALFAMNAPFAFLSFGPSSAGPVPFKKGQKLSEQYEIAVGDIV